MDSVEMDAANTLRGLRGDGSTNTDAQRLDWLDLHPVTHRYLAAAAMPDSNAWPVGRGDKRRVLTNFRDAIDYAMEVYPDV